MIHSEISILISKSIKALQKTGEMSEFDIPDIKVEHPEENTHGDYATNIAMRIAGIIKKNPMETAQTIKNQILNIKITNKKSRIFEQIEIAPPGFINFFLSKEYLQKQVGEILYEGEKFGQLKIGKNKKVQIEFISANPTGPLTVGNARGGPFGDVLGNVLEHAGFKVEKAYYINDYGMQILTLGHSVLKDSEAQYRGDYIDYLNKKIKERDPYKAGEAAAKLIVAMIKKTAKNMGIQYDEWFAESRLHKSLGRAGEALGRSGEALGRSGEALGRSGEALGRSGEAGEVDKTINSLKKKNLIYEKDKAWWFCSSKFGDQRDRVVIKSNGWKTYLAGDLAYHRYKFEKKKFTKAIDVWGADHAGDVAGLQAGIEAMGHRGKLDIILLQFVTLFEKQEKLKMSKRSGVYVTMDELLNAIPLDIVRFFFLQKSADTHLNFDLDLAREQSEKNPVYYIQYAHARICAILRKFSKSEIRNPKLETNSKFQIPNSKLELLSHSSELNLIKQLIIFSEIIEDIAKDYQVQRLPQYALDLATVFHQFYRDCRVVSEDINLTSARLGLVLATKIVLKNTLDLMGIKAPEKM